MKGPRGAARARVVAAELLDKLLGAADNTIAALDPRLGGEASAPLARDRESSRRLGRSASWHTSFGG